MKSNNMTQLFDKLNDLKQVFSYGQKIIPIIQNLVDFMQETVPLIETINQSILDSANKMPKAYYQITDVTHATEVATSEILDIVDTIASEIAGLETVFAKEEIKSEKRNELISSLKNTLAGDKDASDKFNELISLGKFDTDYNLVLNSIEKIKNDAYNITLSLQVQDITSQQLSAVNHLIQSVQLRLSSLIEDIEGTNFNEDKLKKIEPNEKMIFDENATYISDGSTQQLADSLVKGKMKTTQDEIDKLFA